LLQQQFSEFSLPTTSADSDWQSDPSLPWTPDWSPPPSPRTRLFHWRSASAQTPPESEIRRTPPNTSPSTASTPESVLPPNDQDNPNNFYSASADTACLHSKIGHIIETTIAALDQLLIAEDTVTLHALTASNTGTDIIKTLPEVKPGGNYYCVSLPK